MQAAGVVYGRKTQNAPLSGMSEGKPTEKISYSDSGKMVDYLYKDENLKNSMDFLIRNDYPTPEDRELNKQLYGEAEEREHLYNVFKDKTNNALNPKLPDETDRLFLSGFLGDEREQEEYDNKVIYALKGKNDVVNQFRNTEFSYLFDDYTNSYMPKTLMAIDPNLPHEVVDTNQKLSTAFPKDNAEKKIDHNWLWLLRDDFDKPDGWVWALTALASKNPLTRSQTVHRTIWSIGAEAFLKPKGYTEAARLLKHSLQFNPQNIYEGGSSKLANLIKNNQHFKDRVNSLIATSQGKPFHSKKVINFGKGNDLYYALNNCTLEIYGREENGVWTISATVYDNYDYTKITTCMGEGGLSLGTLANDAATVSQLIGAITPYKIQVDFTMEWEQ